MIRIDDVNYLKATEEWKSLSPIPFSLQDFW
jgi:hypothetical protein